MIFDYNTGLKLNVMNKLLITQRRVFIAKPMWRTTAPFVIEEIEEVIKTVLTSEYFKNGIEYIKELDGTKLKRVSKEDIKRLMSYDAESEELVTKLFKIY